jgi:4-amino-4-deoxychorismate lyase
MENPEVIINGSQGDYISSLDRGLLYGDGVFETIAVKQGSMQYWEDHLDRLQLGCQILGIQGLKVSLLEQDIKQLIQSKNEDRCVIKIIITRGIGGRGYRPNTQTLTRIVQKFPWPKYPASFIQVGVKITQCEFRLAKQNRFAQIKHLNRLEQVLARSEWEDEYQEGLVCDSDDNIIEATSSNVFFQIDDVLITPDLSQCGIAGVMRKKVIEYCHANNIDIAVREFNKSELDLIQSMFLCNSIIGIWPVMSYCERELNKTAILEQLVAVFTN